LTLPKKNTSHNGGLTLVTPTETTRPTVQVEQIFLSMGVSFDVPLFTENRQDQEVSAAVSLSEAIKTDKRLVLRE